jgi:hypothetical protein
LITFDADSNPKSPSVPRRPSINGTPFEAVISSIYVILLPLVVLFVDEKNIFRSNKGDDVAVDSNNCRPVTRDEFRTQDPLSMFLLPTEIPYIVLRSVSVTHVFTDVAYIQFQMSKSASSICFCGCSLFSLCTCVFPVGNNYVKRSIRRLDFAKYDLSAVFFETTGGGLDVYRRWQRCKDRCCQ